MTWLRAAVRRWGWKTVGAVITAFGLYVVLPSVITLMGAWPDLGERAAVVVPGAGRPRARQLRRAVGAGAHLAAAHARGRRPPPRRWWGTPPPRCCPAVPPPAGWRRAGYSCRPGSPTATVATALTAIGLLTTGVLLALRC